MKLQHPIFIWDINNSSNFKEKDIKDMLCNHLKHKYYLYIRDSSGKIFAALSFHIHLNKRSINMKGVKSIQNEIYDRCSDRRWGEAYVPIGTTFKFYVSTEKKSYYDKIKLSGYYFINNRYKVRYPDGDKYPSPWIWRWPEGGKSNISSPLVRVSRKDILKQSKKQRRGQI